MGRCPVRSIFPQSLEDAAEETASTWVSKTGCVARCLFFWLMSESSFMQDKIMPLSEALAGYDLFNDMKAQKVIFEAQS